MDKRNKRVLIVLMCGSCILVWRLYVLFFEYLPDYRSRTPSAAAAAAPEAASTAPLNETAQESSGPADQVLEKLLARQDAIAQRPWGESPFIKPINIPEKTATEESPALDEAAPESPAINFVGVSRVGERWLAAVNGRVVRQGDRVAEKFTISGIGKDWISIDATGWRHTYHLGSENASVTRVTERRP